SARMVRERRGQLDALLDVELVLPRGASAASGAAVAPGPDATTILESEATVARGGAPNAPLAPGVMLGKYRLDRLLGAGGMGMVWAARDVDLDRSVALKVLRSSLDGNETARLRLVREARAMARLHHPNVVAIFDACTLEGRDVIAMELFDGETMAAWLTRQPPRDAVVAAILAAGRGLAVAHAAGMIHRDFKPHNVLIDQHGRVVVTDFGLARSIADGGAASKPSTDPRPMGSLDSVLTVPGTMLGTPAYMAPEQLSGGASDARADQFAFSATAWEALAGLRPFGGMTAVELFAAHAEPPRVAERVPRRLRWILARGLAMHPSERWPSVDAMLDAMTRAWRRPRRIALALAAAAAVAAIAVGGLALHRVPWQPRIIDLPAFEENGDGAALSPDGTRLAYISDRERAETFRVYIDAVPGGESRALTAPDDSFQTPRWTRDGKALLLVHWDPVTYRYRIVRQPLEGGPFTDLGPGIQADDCGDVVAIAEAERSLSQLLLRHPDGTRQVLVSTTTEWLTFPRCDRDGKRIVFNRGPTTQQGPIHDVIVIDRAGQETALTRDRANIGGTFTPDGSSVVFTAKRGGKIALFEIPATGGEARQLTFDEGPHYFPDVSGDGRTVAFNLDASAMVVMAGGAGKLFKLTTRREMLGRLVSTRDGKYVIAERRLESRNEVVVISTSDGSERTLTGGGRPFLSADDKRVLFTAADGAPQLFAIPIEGGAVTRLAELPGKLVMGADGPDGLEVEVNRNGVLEAWRVTREGRVESREVGGFVVPAPAGGWRVVEWFNEGWHLRFVPPGAPLTGGLHEQLADSERAVWLDDHRLSYAARGAFHVIDATTGAEVATVPGADWGQDAILVPDGVHWYSSHMIGHVTRHLMVNFDER
ncbi:MAG TPA: protein kinase, partial [Kofleriaceae bacterium]|nr:protein kinase [Kofleriaceae bacterium]